MAFPAVQTKHKGARVSYAAFAAFGVFWGTWGASIPRIRDQSGLTDGQLGTALLFIGAGALPAMFMTGRLLDRAGIRITTAGALILQAAAGLFVSVTATGMTSLCLGLLLVGASSGAVDVAINTGAGSAEKQTHRPVITRSHGTFSAFVVISSLLTGALNKFEMTPAVSFSLVAASMVLAAGYLLSAPPAGPENHRVTWHPKQSGSEETTAATTPRAAFPVLPVMLVGLLAALALAGENAHQSWAAVFFEDILNAGTGFSATAPAMFAAVAAVTRFSTARLNPANSTRTIVLGAVAAAAGSGLLAGSTNFVAALAGLAIAAAGTAVLYPTLLGVVSRTTSEATRGRATSLLATVSYLGFLLGPVYVGLWSESAGLRGAMIAVAALGALIFFLAPPLLRRITTISAPREG
ncbi:MFS transporter [Arthrobacter sp. ATA002]|uniref:MFS transporter n=1 Tax=Arthrobacter sp. ATA002 TaxID=2991715 RepID=UPI0022A7B7BB|nr:MFS transporter [Arthrobacter sp. ATA002]WAP50609.1 MFS transporter [Arthrobacter sp. ATA002]